LNHFLITLFFPRIIKSFTIFRYHNKRPLNKTNFTIYIKSINCENKDLEREFRIYCDTDENSNRVGEFAIGTNIYVEKLIGQILQDEKVPGIHIAFGHPYAEHTGADWLSTTHIDVVPRYCNIWLDNTQIMDNGKFMFDSIDMDLI